MIEVAAQFGRDLRHALHTLRRTPFVAALVIVSTAVGIGVNTTVFSWLDAVVLQPIAGVRDAGAVRVVEPRTERGGYPGASWLEYRDLASALASFESLAAFRMTPLDVGLADGSDRAYGLLVSGNYFSALGLRAAAGRLFRPEDALRPGAEPVVVVSRRFWQTRLAGVPAVVGSTLRVNDRPLTIVGVAPDGFNGTIVGLAFDLWIPATAATIVFDRSAELDARGDREYTAFGQLRPGVTDAQATAELDVAMARLAHDYPASNRNITGEILPFWQSPNGPQRFMAGSLGVLQSVMLLVLAAVCGTTATLMLARTASRRREIGVRLALGAPRWRIVSLLLAEGCVLAAIGTAAGVALAVWGTGALRAVPMPTAFPIRFDTAIDRTSLVFAATLGVVATLIFGLVPALHFARVDPQASIKEAEPTGRLSRRRGRLMQSFVATQVGLAVIVLAVAGVFVERFVRARTTDPGFAQDRVVLAAFDLRERNRAVGTAASLRFASTLLERLRSAPSVASAAIASSVPLDIHGLPSRAFRLEGHARPDGDEDLALTNIVTRGYFATMGIALREGTDFAALTDATAPPQAIVNETFARTFGRDMTMLGRRIDSAGQTYTIVGVVADSTYQAFDEAPTPFIYISFRDRPVPAGEIHVRMASATVGPVSADLREAASATDSSITLYNVRTLATHVDQNLIFQRIPARLFGVAGPLLVGLAAIGIAAVVAYGVEERRRDIGVRLALGATVSRVTRDLVIETMAVVTLGAGAGWLVAWVIERDVMHAPGLDPIRFGAVPALLLIVAAAAAWVPARRAGRRQIMVVMK
jgi:predicted permease